MKMFVGTQWIEKAETIEVRSPYNNALLETVPRADSGDVEIALQTAVRGAEDMAKLTGWDRYKILSKVAQLIERDHQQFMNLISSEEGKPLLESDIETTRSAEIFRLSAEEAKRLSSEVIPLDGAPGTRGKFGFSVRVPCGVVVCISPFNHPLHLVCHKVAPALAAGNSVILKPATDTPLSSYKLVELLLEAGVPPTAVQCLTGSGREIGDALCRDPRVRKISFTGSQEVGERICQVAGIKKVTMELGSNAALIVMDDADIAKAAKAAAVTGYMNAGQICMSTQRAIVHRKVYAEFIEALVVEAKQLKPNDPLLEGTRLGPMIREADAQRVQTWVQEAVRDGARIVAGGTREGTLFDATVIADVDETMRIAREEVFGPVIGVTPFDGDIDTAIAMANDTRYGLSAGIFTKDLDRAMRFALNTQAGNLHINWGPLWRVDLMPFGGLKDSGLGKEGPRYAMEELTEYKTVVMHLDS